MAHRRNYVELAGTVQDPVVLKTTRDHSEMVSFILHVLDEKRTKGHFIKVYFFNEMARAVALGEDVLDPVTKEEVPTTEGAKIWVCGELSSWGRMDGKSGFYKTHFAVVAKEFDLLMTAEEVEHQQETDRLAAALSA